MRTKMGREITGTFFFLVFACLFVWMFSGENFGQGKGPLSKWNDTEVKSKILEFVEKAKTEIPVSERIAVFDMDGTILCEKPLWLEMYTAIGGLVDRAGKKLPPKDSALYSIAAALQKNPRDASALKEMEQNDNVLKMILGAFWEVSEREYMDYGAEYLKKNINIDYKLPLSSLFYPPMLQLINYLRENEFQVYIVSGTSQGLIWVLCEEKLGIGRDRLIGSLVEMSPVYYPDSTTTFVRGNEFLEPMNLKDGKAENIYYRIGKTPVFAFGNSTDDFGMFKITTSNTYPHMELMLHHDDSVREYVYSPDRHDKTGQNLWLDSLKKYDWNLVSMKNCFREVFER